VDERHVLRAVDLQQVVKLRMHDPIDRLLLEKNEFLSACFRTSQVPIALKQLLSQQLNQMQTVFSLVQFSCSDSIAFIYIVLVYFRKQG